MSISMALAYDLPDIVRSHLGGISVLSGTLSLLSALVICSLMRRDRVLRDEKWVKYFAATFFVFAFNGLLRSIIRVDDIYKQHLLPAHVPVVLNLIRSLCSAFTSYLLLYVGFSLVDMSREVRDRVLSRLPLRVSIETKERIARRGTFIFLVLVALYANEDLMTSLHWGGPWIRIPDTLSSALVLVFVSATLYLNIGIRRDKAIATVALISGVLYALSHIYFASVPWLASHHGLRRILDTQEIKARRQDFDLWFIMAAMILKCGLFFAGYTLMLLISATSVSIKTLLDNINGGEGEFLESQGIVKAICEELSASCVELFLRLPGTIGDQVACYKYSTGDAPQMRDLGPSVLPLAAQDLCGHVIKTGKPVALRVIGRPYRAPLHFLESVPERRSILAVPVIFHKATIGCLQVIIDDGRVNEADVKNVERFAGLLTPAAQAYRQIYGLNQLSDHLARLQIDRLTYDLEQDVSGIARILHAVLTPVATAIFLDAGFREYSSIKVGDKSERDVMERMLPIMYEKEDHVLTGTSVTFTPRKLEIEFLELGGESPQTQLQSLGRFVSATRIDTSLGAPALAENQLYAEAVSNLIVDNLLDFVRGYFNQINSRLSVTLGSLTRASIDEWFSQVEAAVTTAGLSWAVATKPSDASLLGGDYAQTLVNIQTEQATWIGTGGTSRIAFSAMLGKVESGQPAITHVIKVELETTEQTLWLGVNQRNFGTELQYTSPWKVFVSRLAEIADAALYRITAKERFERVEKEVSEFHGLATAAVTTGTVIHQIANQVQDLNGPIDMLADAIRRKTLEGNQVHKDAIFSLKRSALMIGELNKMFAGVIKPDSRRPCSLAEAVRYAESLLFDAINRLNITLDVKVSTLYSVDVPFYVAAFTLVNLISNAKDALKSVNDRPRVIRVRANETETVIHCLVSDTGPGFPPHRLHNLFEIGGGSDKIEGSGLGLYLSARSLRENRGDLKLTFEGPSPPTTFTIYFPKRRAD